MTGAPVIEVRDLSFTYPGSDSPALENVSLTVGAGEIVGLLGPSGAGKTTLQKILVGILRDYAGSARVLGRDMRAWNDSDYERVGVSFEFPNLYSRLTGRENLRFFSSLYARELLDVDETLARVGLLDAADVRVSDYSKGMKMRLNVCRALLHQPELLLFDEPTSGQDPVTARKVREVVADQRKRGATVLLATHNMQEATDLCDRVAILVEGRIRLVEVPRNLMWGAGQRRVRVETERDHFTFDLDGLADNPAFIDLLRTGDVRTIHTLEATLEDVFVQTTKESRS